MTATSTIPVLQLLAVASHEQRSLCVCWPLQNSLFAKLQFSSYWQWSRLHSYLLLSQLFFQRGHLEGTLGGHLSLSPLCKVCNSSSTRALVFQSHIWHFFCPRVMESNNYRLISIRNRPVKKGNSLLGQPSYINEKFSVYCWDVFPSNMKVYYPKGKRSNLSTCSAVIFQLQ